LSASTTRTEDFDGEGGAKILGHNDDKDDNSFSHELNTTKHQAGDSRSRLKALEKEIPGMVDEILAFYEDTGVRKDIRGQWNRAYLEAAAPQRLRQSSRPSQAPSRRLRTAAAAAHDDDDDSWGSTESKSNVSTGWDNLGSSSASCDGQSTSDRPKSDSDEWNGFGSSSSTASPWDDLGQSTTDRPESDADSWNELGSSSSDPSSRSNLGQSTTDQSKNESDPWDGLGSSSLAASSATDRSKREPADHGSSLPTFSWDDLDQSTDSKSEPELSNSGRDTDRDTVMADAEKPSNDPVLRALALLRLLTSTDWGAFDRPVDPEEKESRNSILTDDDGDDVPEDTSLDNASVVNNTSSSRADELGDSTGNETDEDNSRIETIHFISDLLNQAHVTSEHFSTSEYNSILARIAISTELLPDNVLDLIMQIYKQMIRLAAGGIRECRPDSTTYEILLLALTGRLHASGTAISVVNDLMLLEPSFWTPNTLEALMLVFEERNSTQLALKLFENLRQKKTTSVEVSKRTFRSLIQLIQFEDNRQKAAEVLAFALKVSATDANARLSFVGQRGV